MRRRPTGALAGSGQRRRERYRRAQFSASTGSSPFFVLSALMVALTFVTGMTDAIGLVRLGGVFTSVMTGNMVFLGTAAGQHSISIAGHVGLAFTAYAVGAMCGARVAGRPAPDGRVWPRSVTRALTVELCLFVVFAVCWELSNGRPGAGLGLGLLATNAVALGMQSSAVLRLGISGLSTTYLTGTLTAVLVAVAVREPSREALRSTAILVGLVVGAAAGAALALSVPRLAPLPLLAALAGVIALSSSRLGGLERE